MNIDDLKEKLAAIEHDRWSDWHNWTKAKRIGLLVADGELVKLAFDRATVDRWDNLAAVPYKVLLREDQLKDLKQVERYWWLVVEYGKRCKLELLDEIERYIREAGNGFGLDNLAIARDLTNSKKQTEE